MDDTLCTHGVTASACVDCLCRDVRSYKARPADPRDAEIARLRAEVERLTRDSTRFDADWSSLRGENDALRDACRAQIDAGAAGRVAALYQRAIAAESDLARHKRALAAGPAALHYRSCDCCSIVERAQAEAMKEKP